MPIDGLEIAEYELGDYVDVAIEEASLEEIDDALAVLDSAYWNDLTEGHYLNLNGQAERMFKHGWRLWEIFSLHRAGWGWQDRYEIVECRGCSRLAFRVRRWEEWRDERERETGQVLHRGETFTSYPPPTSRPTPVWLDELPERLHALMSEVYRALDAGSATLPVIGARTVLDVVMQEKVGDQGNFARLLDALCDEGHITAADKKPLRAAIEIGNAAAHRGLELPRYGGHSIIGHSMLMRRCSRVTHPPSLPSGVQGRSCGPGPQ